jgi:hypothetical protein
MVAKILHPNNLPCMNFYKVYAPMAGQFGHIVLNIYFRRQ